MRTHRSSGLLCSHPPHEALLDGEVQAATSEHPGTQSCPSRFNRPWRSKPDTLENLRGSAAICWQRGEAGIPNFRAVRRSRRLACRQDTGERHFSRAGVGGKTTLDWSQPDSCSVKMTVPPEDEDLCKNCEHLPCLRFHPEMRTTAKLGADLQLPRDSHGMGEEHFLQRKPETHHSQLVSNA